MPARDMAAYMRKRRARQKAERKAAERGAPVIDRRLSRLATLKTSEGELAAVRRKAAAIGPGAVIAMTGERLDVIAREAFEARAAPPAPRLALPPPQPRSMFASGGRPPGGPHSGSIAEASAAWRANVQAMLATLAERADAQDRRIAALEAERIERAMRGPSAVDVANALFGIARAFVLSGG